MKRLLKKILHKTKSFVTGFRQPQPVVISGLMNEEKLFQESMVEECAKRLAKYQKHLPAVQRIALHVKSNQHGGGKLFQIRGTLYLDGTELYAGATDRELYAALMRVLYQFQQEVDGMQSFKKEKKRINQRID